MTFIYGLTHMIVDLSCAFLVYGYVVGEEMWYFWLLLYNFCAFALQMPIGAAADRWNRNGVVAACGCLGVLAGLGLGVMGVSGAAAVVAGIGNACFHVGGGIDVMNRSERKAAPLGIFVAPGALGIYLGSILGKSGRGAALVIAGLLILSAAAIRGAAKRENIWLLSGNAPVAFDGLKTRTVLAGGCFLGAVVLRSYSGMIQNFPWKETLAGSGLMVTAALVLGKMAGGVAADRAGIRRTALWSMGAAAAGFLFLEIPAAGILAVFCWNMSMPLTLWAISEVFPKARGFGFGLLTFGLFIGFCPAYLSGSGLWPGMQKFAEKAASPAGLAVMALLSMCLLGWGLKQAES